MLQAIKTIVNRFSVGDTFTIIETRGKLGYVVTGNITFFVPMHYVGEYFKVV